MAPEDFGRSVNPISTKGADFAHQIILAPPDFQDLPTALTQVIKIRVGLNMFISIEKPI